MRLRYCVYLFLVLLLYFCDRSALSDEVVENKKQGDILIMTVDAPSLEKRIGNWYLMQEDIDGKKVYYMIRYADEKIGNIIEDRRPYIMISYINKNRQEVSINPNLLTIPNGHKTNLSIDGEQFIMIAKNNVFWNKNEAVDFDMISQMINGKILLCNAIKGDGGYSVDIYYLDQFSEALLELIKRAKSNKIK